MLTVLFATRNGALTLPRVMESYGRLESPDGGWKLVVIDNGSTDATLQILAASQRSLPMTVLSELKPGKNAALNTGLGSSEGDLIVFTDDDVIPSPGWLRTLRTQANAHPNYDILGGPILPAWEAQPPSWILSHIPPGPVFGLLDQPEGPVNQRAIFGGNMAIRTRLFQEGHRFSETIGPKGANYVMGSETELLVRLSAAGHQAWFCRDARVSHIIRAYQLETGWLLARARRYGHGQYRLNRGASSPASSWLGVPRWMVRTMVLRTLQYLLDSCLRRRNDAFVNRWEMNVLLGMAVEARKASRQASPTTAPNAQ